MVLGYCLQCSLCEVVSISAFDRALFQRVCDQFPVHIVRQVLERVARPARIQFNRPVCRRFLHIVDRPVQVNIDRRACRPCRVVRVRRYRRRCCKRPCFFDCDTVLATLIAVHKPDAADSGVCVRLRCSAGSACAVHRRRPRVARYFRARRVLVHRVRRVRQNSVSLRQLHRLLFVACEAHRDRPAEAVRPRYAERDPHVRGIVRFQATHALGNIQFCFLVRVRDVDLAARNCGFYFTCGRCGSADTHLYAVIIRVAIRVAECVAALSYRVSPQLQARDGQRIAAPRRILRRYIRSVRERLAVPRRRCVRFSGYRELQALFLRRCQIVRCVPRKALVDRQLAQCVVIDEFYAARSIRQRHARAARFLIVMRRRFVVYLVRRRPFVPADVRVRLLYGIGRIVLDSVRLRQYQDSVRKLAVVPDNRLLQTFACYRKGYVRFLFCAQFVIREALYQRQFALVFCIFICEQNDNRCINTI